MTIRDIVDTKIRDDDADDHPSGDPVLRTVLTPLLAIALTGTALTGSAAALDRDTTATTAHASAGTRGPVDLQGTVRDAAARAGLSDLPGLDALGGLGSADLLPPVIPLPDGFAPEGVAVGFGAVLFAGSLEGGAIWRGDALTGSGEVLVPAQEGQVAVGIEVDRRGRVWVSGGPTGQARVYDGKTGAELASYQLLPAGEGFINDVVVTPTAAYFTDSQSATVRVVPIGRGGKLADEPVALPLSGDFQLAEGFNLNGIETTPDGEALLAVQSATGLLFRIDPATGATTRVAGLEDQALSNGDGLLRQDGTLYVVRNRINEVAVLDLDAAGTSATISSTLTDSDFDVPTTIGLAGPFLYAVNARFGTEVTPTTEYDIVRVTRN